MIRAISSIFGGSARKRNRAPTVLAPHPKSFWRSLVLDTKTRWTDDTPFCHDSPQAVFIAFGLLRFEVLLI
jgi:hypothetical protein